MSALLIFTVGHTDVQLVVDGQRWELDKQLTAKLHAELAQREADWKLVEAPERRSRTSWPAARGQDGELLPPGELALCTPKLDAVLRWCQASGHRLSHALILHTDRAKQDPTQAGPIVQRRLGDTGEIQAVLTSYLTGDESKEDPRDPRDAILRRDAVERLAQAITGEIAAAGATTIVVAAAGGIPQVSSLVRELAALHAEPGAVHDLDVPDSSRTGGARDVASERMQPTDPSAVVAAKRHALALVQGGSFIAAWGAVAHLHADAACKPWTEVIRWLYLWASSLPLDDSDGRCILPFPAKERHAAHAAMRVELALRCGDIPRAAQGTVSFFEAAVREHLRKCITPTGATSDQQKPMYQVTPDPLSLTEDQQTNSKLKKVFGKKAGGYTISDFGKYTLTIVEHFLHAPGAPSCSATGRLAAAVPAFSKAFDLRNAVAHGEPTQAEVHEMRDSFIGLGLWSGDGCFLSQPLIRDVLVELGVTEAESLCARLINEVTARLRTPARERS